MGGFWGENLDSGCVFFFYAFTFSPTSTSLIAEHAACSTPE